MIPRLWNAVTDWDPVPSGVPALFQETPSSETPSPGGVIPGQRPSVARGEQRGLVSERATGAARGLSWKVGWDLAQTLGFLLALALPRWSCAHRSASGHLGFQGSPSDLGGSQTHAGRVHSLLQLRYGSPDPGLMQVPPNLALSPNSPPVPFTDLVSEDLVQKNGMEWRWGKASLGMARPMWRVPPRRGKGQ